MMVQPPRVPRAGLLTTHDFHKFQFMRMADRCLHWKTLASVGGVRRAHAYAMKRATGMQPSQWDLSSYDGVRLLGMVELGAMPMADIEALFKLPYKTRVQKLRVLALRAEIDKIEECRKLLPKLRAELRVEEAALAAMPK